MRTIAKKFPVLTQTQETATREDIVVKNTNKEMKLIYVEVSFTKEDGTELNRDKLTITGENYDLLMSESPEFAPNKPINDFREEDLFYIIDKMRAGI